MLTAIDKLFLRSLTISFTIWLLVAVAVLIGIILLIRALVRTYLWYGGTCLVTCPETEQYAAMKIGLMRAALKSLFGKSDLRVMACSHWPDRQNCGQACTWQLDFSPIGCRIRDLLNYWYRWHDCAYCGHLFGKLRWFDHPAMLSADGRIVEWGVIRPEAIPIALHTCKPVCSNCKAVERHRVKRAGLSHDGAGTGGHNNQRAAR